MKMINKHRIKNKKWRQNKQINKLNKWDNKWKTQNKKYERENNNNAKIN